MKTTILLVFVLGVVSLAPAQETIKVGYFDNRPHVFAADQATKDAKPSGALVKLWQDSLAPKMGVKVEWVGPLPPARLLTMLQSGDINTIALLSKNPEREKIYDYPAEPFQPISAGVAIVKGGWGASVKLPGALKEKKIVFFKDGFVPPVVQKAEVSWEFLPNADWKLRGLKMVVAGREDGVFDPDSTTLADAIASSADLSGKLDVLKIPGTESAIYSVFSKTDQGKYLKPYEKALAAVFKANPEAYVQLLKERSSN